MSTATAWTAATSGPTWLLPLRRINRFHPEWWAAALAATAWAALFVSTIRDLAAEGLSGHDHGLGPTSSRSPGAVLAAWAVMSVAMMVPLVVPTVRHVALSSLWGRRHRAAAAFLGGYLAVWTAAGLVIMGIVAALAALAGATVARATAFGGAAVWQLTPFKRRFLRRCAYTSPLSPTGWRADRDCARFGGRIGLTCVATCWALMAATVASAHTLEMMLAVFAVQLHERYRRRPSLQSGALATAALGVLLVVSELVFHG